MIHQTAFFLVGGVGENIEHTSAICMNTPPGIYWYRSESGGRNVFCFFRKTITLAEHPMRAELHIFADSLYRLRINECVIGHGPARFVPSHPEFDTHDLRPWLREGTNEILIEANVRGTECYQGEVGPGGVGAWGEIERANGTRISLDLPQGWETAKAGEWEENAENFSFAQGPIEIRDFRKADAGLQWKKPEPVAKREHWGKFGPRSIPMPSERSIHPARIVVSAPLGNHHHRYGFRSPETFFPGRLNFVTHLHSPRDQDVKLGVFWGPLFLDGELLTHENCDLRGNRENARVRLSAGWHLLCGSPELLSPCWPWLMEIPDKSGVMLRALPDEDCPHAFYYRKHPPFPEGVDWIKTAPNHLSALENFPKNWTATPLNERPPSPAREMAWDRPDPTIVRDCPWKEEQKEIPLSPGGEGCVVLDFGGEFLGHAWFEIEASAGTVLDIGYDERLLPESGTIDFYRCNPFANTADRMILKEGRQTVEMFHERGGRYIQLTVRNAIHPIHLHAAGVKSSLPSYPVEGDFHCGDSVFDWTWKTGVATQLASMADGWIDPWRERGLYLGDFLVEAHCTAKFTGDRRLEKWCLRLWARAQRSDGQLPDVVPSNHAYCLNDYTLLWPQCLFNYWASTGDLSLVDELWPVIPRIFGSPVWKTGEEKLWRVTEGMKIFVDWGAELPDGRLGTNAVLNAFRFRALECASQLAGALDRHDEAADYLAQSGRVADAFRNVFWNRAHERFVATLVGGKPSPVSSYHANALALAYGLASEEQVPGSLDYLKSGLRLLADNSLPVGSPELYFQYYVLDALRRHGEAAFAEETIRSIYGVIRRRGAWTLPETFARQMSGLGSMCHGWSAAPMVYFSEQILGVRPRKPGRPQELLIAPEASTIDGAEGIVPHPAGLVGVKWELRDDCLRVGVIAPSGVTCLVRPSGRLANFPLEASVNGQSVSGWSGTKAGAPSEPALLRI